MELLSSVFRAADGYRDEVNDFIGRALEQFTTARDKIASMGDTESNHKDFGEETREW